MIKEDCFDQTTEDEESTTFKRKDTATQIDQVALDPRDLQAKDLAKDRIRQLPLSAGCPSVEKLVRDAWSEFIESIKQGDRYVKN